MPVSLKLSLRASGGLSMHCDSRVGQFYEGFTIPWQSPLFILVCRSGINHLNRNPLQAAGPHDLVIDAVLDIWLFG